jgi:hypothetical protein
MSWEESKHNGSTSRHFRDRIRTNLRLIYIFLGKGCWQRTRRDDLNEERGTDGTIPDDEGIDYTDIEAK